MAIRASRRKSWFLGVVLALAPIAAFGEDIDGQIDQLLEKIRQQDTTSGDLTELIDEALPLMMSVRGGKVSPESLGRIQELSALIERKSALSRVGQAESAGGQAGGVAGRAEADSAVPAPPGTASPAPMPTVEPAVPKVKVATPPPADTAPAPAGRSGHHHTSATIGNATTIATATHGHSRRGHTSRNAVPGTASASKRIESTASSRGSASPRASEHDRR